MTTHEKIYPSISVLGRHIAVLAQTDNANSRSLLLATILAALSITVLSIGGFASPYDLTSGALIFCCSYLVAVRGGERSFAFGTSSSSTKQATFEGNLGLIYTVLATFVVILIVLKIVRMTIFWP